MFKANAETNCLDIAWEHKRHQTSRTQPSIHTQTCFYTRNRLQFTVEFRKALYKNEQ